MPAHGPCAPRCRYLYKSHSPGVQDYLCNRLYTLPERDVEHYLGQLTQLCIQRPGSSLERVLTDLCAQSLRIAVKVRAGSAQGGGCWEETAARPRFAAQRYCQSAAEST